jgi:O-antigen/teichoic acid export membrane protein
MAVALFLTGLFTCLRYLSLRQERFSTIARTTVAQQTARTFSQVGFGFAGFGPAGLLGGELAGRTAGVIPLLRREWPWLKLGMNAAPGKILGVLSRNRELAVYSLPSSLIDALAINMLVPCIVQLYGPNAGGQLALVLRVLAIPIVLIATSVADSFHSRLAIYAREAPEKMVPLFKRTTVGLFLAGLGPAAAIALGGGQIFSFIFGKEWVVAGTLAMLSTPFLLAQITVSPLTRVVFVLRGQRSKLLYDIFLLAGVLGVFKYASVYKLTLTQTVLAFSVVNTLAFILYYIVLARIVAKAAAGSSISREEQR